MQMTRNRKVSRNLKLFYYFIGRDKKAALVFAKKYAKEILAIGDFKKSGLRIYIRTMIFN